jgi:hypothetical protein
MLYRYSVERGGHRYEVRLDSVSTKAARRVDVICQDITVRAANG